MSVKPRFRLVIASDRYELEWEASAIAQVPDMDFELSGGAVETEDDLISIARNADALLISSREAITAHVLSNLSNCKVISRRAVGLDHIDLDTAAELGIVVTHSPDYCTNEVADHTLALILSLNRRILEFDQDLHRGAWTDHKYKMNRILRGPIQPLREQTLGIVGLGRIGRAVARRALPFGLKMLAADPHIDSSTAAESRARLVSLDELLESSDIVSLHCPLTSETQGLIGAREIGLMKPTAVLVNTARGPVVDLDAAATALANRSIAAAAVDVVYPEPLPHDSPLYSLPNVILTPHAAYYSERSRQQVRVDALNGALAVLRGRQPRTLANPKVLERVNLLPPA
jgi:D-3-phosphoglycerate dehydrogenase / 2-oxoglutarate reductase